jgi:hypothetical protein
LKTIYQLAFKGTSFKDKRFSDESGLIRAGHVGFMFDLTEHVIYGFHPTPEAIEAIGGEEAAIVHLKNHGVLDGALYDDRAIFERACFLVQNGAPTEVWIAAFFVSDADYERIRAQTILWYTDKTIFDYGFPPDAPKPNQDNCATFPRRLGLQTLDAVGQIRDVMENIRQRGEVWCRDAD